MSLNSLRLGPALILALLAPSASAFASPCDAGTSYGNPFQYLRVRTACEFRDAMLKGYSLIYQKEKRIRNGDGSPFRSGQHLNSCIDHEFSIPDTETPSSHIDWLDRVRACGAAFQDTHLDIQPMKQQPWISLGFSMTEINGHFYIRSVAPRVLLSHMPREQALKFQAGTEVVSIDLRPIQELVKELLPLVPGSSETYRRKEALNLVTERAFHYPEKPITWISLNGEAPIQTRWAADFAANQDPLSRQALEERGFQHTPSLPWLDPSNLPDDLLKEPDFAGYSDQDAAVPPTAAERLMSYRGASTDEPALRFVRVDSMLDDVEKSYCYLQLASFADDRVRGVGKHKQEYATPMRKFLRQCKRADLPLILDIRTNPGGYLDLGAQTLSAITPRNQKSSTRSTWAFREDEVYREVDGAYFDGEYWGGNTVEVEPRNRSDRRVGGYSGKVLALITPYCISSCDRLAAFLKTSGRATLIGSPTNGTGAGFQDWTDPSTGRLHSDWQDSTSTLTAQIPDQLFGALPANAVRITSGKPKGFFPWLRWITQGRPEATEYLPLAIYESSSLLENQPTQPDVSYSPGVRDLQHGQDGWIEAIQAQLQ